MATERENVYVIGVGMTPFTQPKLSKKSAARDESGSYPSLVQRAGSEALLDAQCAYSTDIDACVASYCYGEPTAGQCALYTLGTTGVPIFNTNNNCSSASSALMLGRALVKSGFEQMERGLSEKYQDRVSPVARHFARIEELTRKMQGGPVDPLPGMNKMTGEVIRLYAMAAREYQQKYGDCTETFAKIAVKNRTHGSSNPLAALCNKPIPTVRQAQRSGLICAPITVHQCALTADGAAAAILCSERWLRNRPVTAQRAVPILAQRMCTDDLDSFTGGFMELSGARMAKLAADQCFSSASSSPSMVSHCELHDCFAPNELFMYESLGFANRGTGKHFFDNGVWDKSVNSSRVYMCNGTVFNVSGGLESKGHPIGATGLGQCYEIVRRLRMHGRNDGKSLGLQHNFGIGGAAVVTLYSKPLSRVAKL